MADLDAAVHDPLLVHSFQCIDLKPEDLTELISKNTVSSLTYSFQIQVASPEVRCMTFLTRPIPEKVKAFVRGHRCLSSLKLAVRDGSRKGLELHLFPDRQSCHCQSCMEKMQETFFTDSPILDTDSPIL